MRSRLQQSCLLLCSLVAIELAINLCIFLKVGVAFSSPIRKTQQLYSSPTTALCYKTLFGKVQLDRVAHWVRYHHLLGFDHIFMWYLPEIRNKKGFEELALLPYITLLENVNVHQIEGAPQLTGTMDQQAVGDLCLRSVAASFDWVMTADTDEYLRFNETIGLKPFIRKYGSNFTYMSFGKHMYTMEFRTESDPGPFNLSIFPFFVGPYCDARPGCPFEPVSKCRGNPVCPMHFGRAKVLLRPRNHFQYSVHGAFVPSPQNGSVHFNTNHAYIMEWPWLYRKRRQRLVPRKDFHVNASAKMRVHQWEQERSYTKNPDGTYTVRYDKDLQAWFNFVDSLQGP